MSSGSQETRDPHEELLVAFAREVKQLNGLTAFFFRAAAARAEINVTDLEVVGLLELGGPMTAGQLAELMGLTTGAITGMVDRMEKAGYVIRERDPEDGRRVIVRLDSEGKALKKIAPVLDSIQDGWGEIAAEYDDTQLAMLVDFLQKGSAMSREEIARLRMAAGGDQGFTAPLANLREGVLTIAADSTDLFVQVGTQDAELYRATFEGPVPKVSVENETISIRYSRRLLGPGLGSYLGLGRRVARINLSDAAVWQIAIRGAGSSISVALTGLPLARLEVEGAGSMIQITLPKPSGVVPVKAGGGGSDITIRRPADAAMRAQARGWGSAVAFDDQPIAEVSSGLRLNTPGHEEARDVYEIEVSGTGSMFKIGV